jgi:hypothetical protein
MFVGLEFVLGNNETTHILYSQLWIFVVCFLVYWINNRCFNLICQLLLCEVANQLMTGQRRSCIVRPYVLRDVLHENIPVSLRQNLLRSKSLMFYY